MGGVVIGWVWTNVTTTPPLHALSKCVGSSMSNKEKHFLQSQVFCVPSGYDHHSIIKAVNSFLPEKIFVRDNGGGNIFPAQERCFDSFPVRAISIWWILLNAWRRRLFNQWLRDYFFCIEFFYAGRPLFLKKIQIMIDCITTLLLQLHNHKHLRDPTLTTSGLLLQRMHVFPRCHGILACCYLLILSISPREKRNG